jgi:hypothetical protein
MLDSSHVINNFLPGNCHNYREAVIALDVGERSAASVAVVEMAAQRIQRIRELSTEI